MIAERWAALEGDTLDVALDRRVGGVLLDVITKNPRPAGERLDYMRDLAEHWLTPGELGLFYPAAGQCVLDAINGTDTAAQPSAFLDKYRGTIREALRIAVTAAENDRQAERFEAALAAMEQEG